MAPNPVRVVRGLGRLRFGRGPGMLPRGRQFVEMLAGAVQGGFTPLEYQLYGFGRRDRDRSGYVPLRWIEREFRARLNPPEAARVLKDKLEFFRSCRARGLPAARVLALVGSGMAPGGVAALGDAAALVEFLAGLAPGRFVAKPAGSVGGKGVMLFDRRPDGSFADATGELTPAALWARMAGDIERQAREDARTGYLLQEFVRPDPAMNPGGGTALNTVRIATLLDPGGEARLDFAMLRLARPGAPSDNLHQGGTVAGIDLETGAIRAPAWGYETPDGPWLAPRSADPAALFRAGRLPRWDELAALARACALALPGARSVGWDIVLADTGPVVIEGNDNWDMVIAQVLDGPYLTPMRRELLTELGLRLPARVA
ncbi:MAG: sugar-transfer associated ATP-grasp domain-containing protein [bacterium]